MKTFNRIARYLSLLVFATAGYSAHAEETLTVYFIGNSLTMSTTLDRVHALFEERGIDLQFGSQLSGGKSLIRHLNYKDEPGQKWVSWETNVPSSGTYEPDKNHYNMKAPRRFGLYDTALVDHKWDKCVFQFYESNLHDDYNTICAFIDLALENKTCEEFYIYSTWPMRPKKMADGEKMALNIDYPGVWDREYPYTHEDTGKASKQNSISRNYTAKLMALLNEKYAELEHPIRLIPAGEVLYALDKKIKANTLPGLAELAERQPDLVPGLDEDTTMQDGINVLYADPIHLNPIPHQSNTVGIFTSGSTVFTVLSGENPTGMSAAPYGLDDPKDKVLTEAIQSTIWDVVTSEPLTGVK